MRRSFVMLLALLAVTQLHAEGNRMVPLDQDGIHDPDSPAFFMLQEPAEGMGHLPTNRAGDINWVQALEQDLIHPRADLSGEKWLAVVDLDVIMPNTASMPPVRFSHEVHTRWLSCDNCHNAIFLPKAGANFVTMQNILDGHYCGVCHGRVAFDVHDCEICHSDKPFRRGLR